MRASLQQRLTPFVSCLASVRVAASDLTVLSSGPDGIGPGRQFEMWLKNDGYRLLDEGKAAFETLETVAEGLESSRRSIGFTSRELQLWPGNLPTN